MPVVKEIMSHTFFFVVICSTIVALVDKQFSSTAYKDVMISSISALAGLHVPIDRNKKPDDNNNKKVL